MDHEPASLASLFAIPLLRARGWPRRQGLLGHKYVDAYTAVGLVHACARAGVALGLYERDFAVDLLAGAAFSPSEEAASADQALAAFERAMPGRDERLPIWLRLTPKLLRDKQVFAPHEPILYSTFPEWIDKWCNYLFFGGIYWSLTRSASFPEEAAVDRWVSSISGDDPDPPTAEEAASLRDLFAEAWDVPVAPKAFRSALGRLIR